ncbi:MAG: hypothetical protein J6U00_09675 [Ruminococcus sp.]|uniref:hypothetical protein n=1 Tax=Ruminococcus sp. TaxID=41978 RepID=UPI001B2F7199|nr:hypothetical protein [Ruminococcus sp.]MBO7474246.1 hypothetical protein [Ruminococcus sp.]
MHIRKILSIIATFSALSGSTLVYSLSVNAATVDDVAAVARSYGYSEEDIQAGYNAYYENPAKYPPELLDQVIAYLHEAGNQIIATAPQEETSPVQTTTTTAAAISEENNAEIPEPVESGIVLTASDGSTFIRISREEFISMSYDEKMSYVHSFTPAQQQAIIDDLSPEEYKSLIKQSPADQKIQIVGKLSEAAEEMGLNVTVDEITDNSLTVAMRNDKGELLNVSTAGATVEDTGYDRRGILAASTAFITIGIASACLLMRRIKKNGAEN